MGNAQVVPKELLLSLLANIFNQSGWNHLLIRVQQAIQIEVTIANLTTAQLLLR